MPKQLPSAALECLVQEERIRPDLIPLQSGKNTYKKLSVAEAQCTYGTPAIYLTPLYFGEKGVAERVKALAGSQSLSTPMNHSLFPADGLSTEQQAAIDMALSHPLSILTGGPGAGKTTCIKALNDSLEAQHKKYAFSVASSLSKVNI